MLFGLHTLRYRIYQEPGHGLRQPQRTTRRTLDNTIVQAHPYHRSSFLTVFVNVRAGPGRFFDQAAKP